jgi:hypothetical protein
MSIRIILGCLKGLTLVIYLASPKTRSGHLSEKAPPDLLVSGAIWATYVRHHPDLTGSVHAVDWVTSLFRRVLALFENLPEEGGKKNTTGGKQEENVLKSVKSMLDVVCLHLSDQLFDLVLNLVFNYATTNAKSNAVRAFGHLVACLARARPEKTITKFLPFCIAQIEDELKYGASSIRTTSTHEAVPSDTTLHWSMPLFECTVSNTPLICL